MVEPQLVMFLHIDHSLSVTVRSTKQLLQVVISLNIAVRTGSAAVLMRLGHILSSCIASQPLSIMHIACYCVVLQCAGR